MLQAAEAEPGAIGDEGEPDQASAELAAAIAALEELLGGRGLFRRFLAQHTARGSAAAAACSQPSFLAAAAGILRRARLGPSRGFPPQCPDVILPLARFYVLFLAYHSCAAASPSP
jgi:hypothetical protein